jgi:hypothetical protein
MKKLHIRPAVYWGALTTLAVALAAGGCGGGGSSNGTGGTGGGGAGGTGGGTGGTGGGGGAGGTGGAPGVSYARDVKPIFMASCIDCHSPGGSTGYDMVNPFDPATGIVRRVNSWYSSDGSGAKESLVVDPGNVGNSFLIRKVDGSMLGDHDGGQMPPEFPYLNQAEVDNVSRWITDGAKNDAFFMANVAPIFGTQVTLSPTLAGRCTYCHFPGSATGMSVINVFDASTGMVDRASRYGMKIVTPGNPSASQLIKKLTGATLATQMPLRKARLTPAQVETLRQWILAGAPNN